MKRNWAYLKYVLRHKYYVLLECFKLRIYWRGITHDLSKLLPSEFKPYAIYFYDHKGNSRETPWLHSTTYFQKQNYREAWDLHLKRNSHHWQFHSIGSPMPAGDMLEMIADWKAMEHNGSSALDYYTKMREGMEFNALTRLWVEDLLGYDRGCL
jgi:hypothetical protein